jgi:hypothetical protein
MPTDAAKSAFHMRRPDNIRYAWPVTLHRLRAVLEDTERVQISATENCDQPGFKLGGLILG